MKLAFNHIFPHYFSSFKIFFTFSQNLIFSYLHSCMIFYMALFEYTFIFISLKVVGDGKLYSFMSFLW